MAEFVATAHDKRCTRAHRYHNGVVQVTLVAGSQGIGYELVAATGLNAVDITLDISSSHTCQHHVLYFLELQVVVMKILAKGTIE